MNAPTPHTPGPWQMSRDVFPPVYSVAVLPPPSVSELPIAYAVTGAGDQPDIDTAAANACLIAAAPELLASCERFSACVASMTRNLTFLGPALLETGVIADVLAAIAKAKGATA